MFKHGRSLKTVSVLKEISLPVLQLLDGLTAAAGDLEIRLIKTRKGNVKYIYIYIQDLEKEILNIYIGYYTGLSRPADS